MCVCGVCVCVCGVCVCVCVCVRGVCVCACACMRACVRACVRVHKLNLYGDLDLTYFILPIHCVQRDCPAIIVPEVVLTCIVLLPSQANLRYRELNDALENVQEKLRDARVRLQTVCMYVHLL